jgi:hypothetical protein
MLCGKNLTRWPWKSLGFQIFWRTKYVPSLVKIHWNILILECPQGCYRVKISLWPWKSIRFQNTKFGQNPLKDVDSRVFTRMLHGKNLTRWPWPWKSIGFQIFLRAEYVPSLVKIHWKMLILECSQGCYKVKNETLWPWQSIGFQTLLRTKYVPSLVKIHWRMLILGCYAVKIWPGDLDLWPWKSLGFQIL